MRVRTWMAHLRWVELSTRLPCKTQSCVPNVTSSVTARTIDVVCGSRSLLNIARMFGGNLPQNRAFLIPSETAERQREIVLSFSRHRRRRVKAIG